MFSKRPIGWEKLVIIQCKRRGRVLNAFSINERRFSFIVVNFDFST